MNYKGITMLWLELLIDKFCEVRVSSFYSKMYTTANYVFRAWFHGKAKNRAYSDLASTDVTTSTRLQSLVETSCATLSTEDLQKGKLALKLHISTMESRNSYLIIFAALITTLAVSFRLMGLTVLAVGIIIIGLPLVMADRSRITERKHQLDELLVYLEHVKELREPKK